MRKPRKGSNYVMLSDGDFRSLWNEGKDSTAMAAFVRRVIVYAQATLGGISPQSWGSQRQPAVGSSYLLVGTSDHEQIWTGLSQDQCRTMFQWVFDESHRPLAPARPGV
jgi:hypothetical protein